jgi:phosphorylated CTD-interacting factor 1
MPKITKKRRRERKDVLANGLFNIPGLTGEADNSLETCLAEFGTATAVPLFKTEKTSHEPLETHSHQTRNINVTSTEIIKPKDQSFFAACPSHTKDLSDRVSRWNREFRTFVDQGTYTPGLLPSFDVEVARHFQVKDLSVYLLESCPGIKIPAFERWLIDSKIEERQRIALNQEELSQHNDLILSHTTLEYGASQRLVAELSDAGVSQDRAIKAVKELCRRTQAAIPELASQTRRFALRTPLRKGDRIDVVKDSRVFSLVFHRKSWKKPFRVKINVSHYHKLKTAFLRVHNSDHQLKPILLYDHGKPTKAVHSFHLIIMSLLLRYSALSGGQLLVDLRGGGMQGAVHDEVFEALRTCFPNESFLECFASPLNCYAANFGSAFTDIDFHFGSVGDFLDQSISHGVCEANPPFSPGLMDTMVDRIEYNLTLADQTSSCLTFVVIIPTASTSEDVRTAKRFATKSFQRMLGSAACRLHISLAARDHGYIEGAQHLRPTRYKESNFDTSVILLQSSAARKENIDENNLEKRLRSAFTSRHKAEVDTRKEQELSE